MEPLAEPVVALQALWPLGILVGAALVVILLDAFLARASRAAAWVSIAALVACFAVTIRFLAERPPDPFASGYAADGFGHVLDLVFYLAGLAAVLLARGSSRTLDRPELHVMLLLAVTGMVALAHASSLVTLFLALELLSLSLYVLTGFFQHRERSVEAALKYFFLGAFAAGFLVYGMALVYGATGSFEIARIGLFAGETVRSGAPAPLLLLAGMGLLLIGFGFKISSVPFHMWTPDVYEGAPTPVAAFMSVGTKAAAFAALVRTFTVGLGPLALEWRPVVAAIAVATMLVGNLVGLTQRNLKRLLAYSSIAHAGYALVGLVAWDHRGREAVLFYLVAYAFMNLGAFAAVSVLERRAGGLGLHELAGLARRQPWLAAVLSLFLLSLAGVPPTAGFMGKFVLFLAAVEAGYTALAVLAVLYSAIAAYYYLRVIVVMYMQAPAVLEGEPEPAAVPVPAGSALVLAVSAAGVIALGVAPSGVLGLVARAVSGL